MEVNLKKFNSILIEEESEGRMRRCLKPLIGVLATASSAAIFTFSNLLVKWLTGVDSFTISFFRFVGILVGALPIAAYNYLKEGLHPLPKGKRLALFGRSILSSICLLVHFYALKHLPIADVNLITASAPVFTVFSARIFLKEPISKVDLLNIGIILIGVVLIVKPPFLFGESEIYANDPEAWIAVVAMLIMSVFLLSNSYTLLRFLRDLPLATILLNFGSVGVLFAGISSIFLGCRCLPEQSDYESWIFLFLTGLSSFVGQLGVAFAARFESAAKVSLYREAFELLFSFIFQIAFFNDIPDVLTIIGAVLVFGAIMIASSKNVIKSLPETYWIRNPSTICMNKN